MADGAERRGSEKILGNFKKSEWNCDRNEMPKYSVLEIIIEDQIDFDNRVNMTHNIINRSVSMSLEIQGYLKSVDR